MSEKKSLTGISIKYWIYKQFWSLLDYVYPPECGGCGKKGYRLCQDCIANITKQDSKFSNLRYPNPFSDISSKQITKTSYNMIIASVGPYDGPVKNAIHKLKYDLDIGLGEILSRFLIDLYTQLSWKIDIVVPVPLNTKRHRERGFNQSSLLAFPLALSQNIKFEPKAIKRIIDTQSQIGLDATQRFNNLDNAFFSNSDIVGNKTILMVDDVSTTGATLLSCKSSLMSCGAKEVYGLTLAKT